MSNDQETHNVLREIFASIKGPAWWERPDVDADKLALQSIENSGPRHSTASLDKLINKLDGKEPASAAPAPAEDQSLEDDHFPEAPMAPEESASAKINAIGQYAKIMITLSQLRARTTDWIDIPTSDELNDAFQKAGEGDIEKQLDAAEKYVDQIAVVIEENARSWEKFQGHVGRVETHLAHKVDLFDLPAGFAVISKGISDDLHEERRLASYIDENVIDLRRYPLPVAHTPAGNS